MRVNEYNSNGNIDTRKQAFNQWVLTIGDGKVPARTKDRKDKPTWIEIPETFLIPSSESPIQQIVKETYPNFIRRQKDDTYLREQAILTPRNDDADAINAYMFEMLADESLVSSLTGMSSGCQMRRFATPLHRALSSGSLGIRPDQLLFLRRKVLGSVLNTSLLRYMMWLCYPFHRVRVPCSLTQLCILLDKLLETADESLVSSLTGMSSGCQMRRFATPLHRALSSGRL
nr:hypothetical protein [Tanacetum cinerariifolium]